MMTKTCTTRTTRSTTRQSAEYNNQNIRCTVCGSNCQSHLECDRNVKNRAQATVKPAPVTPIADHATDIDLQQPLPEFDPTQLPTVTVTIPFLFAGKAVFTVDNGAGTHFTYKVRAWTPEGETSPIYLTYLLTGPDRSRDWSYLGTLRNRAGLAVTFRLSPKSKVSTGALSVKVLEWALSVVDGRYQANHPTKPIPPQYSIRHIGVCARCGRPLTHPESLTTGFGPDCYEIVTGGGK